MHTNAPFFKTLKCLNLLKFTNFLDIQMLSRRKSIEILKFQNQFQVNILNSSQNESQIKTKKMKLERKKIPFGKQTPEQNAKLYFLNA